MYAIDIKRFREVNNIKQSELAKYLEVGQSFLSQIESGRRPFPDEYISRLLANSNGWDVSMLIDAAQDISRTQRAAKRRTRRTNFIPSLPAEKEVLEIITSQQETIRNQSETLMEQARLISRLLDQSGIKKEDALQEDPAECADALGA